MQKAFIELPEIKLVGITCRTSNKLEMDLSTGQIGPKVHEYFSNNIAQKIISRKKPGITYAVYTDYESDYTGSYTYFIGEEVFDFQNIPQGLKTIIIPAQKYIKFTNGPGAMPSVCIEAWQKIWVMQPEQLGGTRAYIADFEIYDDRSTNPQDTILDICIGIRE